jgi:hypothetical protein
MCTVQWLFREVYTFFGIGDRFLSFLELIGTNRKAQALLDG